MDLHNRLLMFADVLASAKFQGQDVSACDYRDVDAAIGRAKAEVKMEIGLLLLELLAPEREQKRATLKLV